MQPHFIQPVLYKFSSSYGLLFSAAFVPKELCRIHPACVGKWAMGQPDLVSHTLTTNVGWLIDECDKSVQLTCVIYIFPWWHPPFTKFGESHEPAKRLSVCPSPACCRLESTRVPGSLVILTCRGSSCMVAKTAINYDHLGYHAFSIVIFICFISVHTSPQALALIKAC